MACRNAYKKRAAKSNTDIARSTAVKPPVTTKATKRLLFGVDSLDKANDLLQNNLDEFEWVVRNKIYPNFFGRYITGDSPLTKDEIKFIHSRGCMIAVICADKGEKISEDRGSTLGRRINALALDLDIPEGTAIFLEIEDSEKINRDFLKGFAKALISKDYTPGFKANTDAKFDFDREFSRGMQTDKDIFSSCLIWAVAPVIQEYNGITTTHLIHPDSWMPFAPSGIKRSDIAIWQYGRDCHPIYNCDDKLNMFNLDLVINEQVIIEKMF